MSYTDSMRHWYDLSDINPDDLGIPGGNPGTGVGLTVATDIVNGISGMATEYNGTDETTDFGDIGVVRTIAFWIKPATTTEEILLLDAGVDIMVNGGTITYTGVGADATYVNGEPGTTLVANRWQHVVCVLDADTDCNTFEAATDGTNFGAIVLDELMAFDVSLTNLQVTDLYLRTRRGVLTSWRIRHPLTVVSRWPLQGAAGVITPDSYGRYPGTLVNAPTWGVGPKNSLQCIELDGLTQHVNVGDIAELNAATQFTICFWMAQDILNVFDYIFTKEIDALHNLAIFTQTNVMYINIRDTLATAGNFTYAPPCAAGGWNHIAIVYDGSQATNASRLMGYIDGIPQTLGYAGAILVALPDLAGADATIGTPANSFDGRLWDFRLASVAYTRDEISRIIHSPAPLY